MPKLPPQAEEYPEIDWSSEAAALQELSPPLVPPIGYGGEEPEETVTVIAIDPGKMTGISLWVSAYPDMIGGSEVTKEQLPKLIVFLMLSQPGTIEVVCEDFIISERTIKTKQDHNALRIIGWLDLHCAMTQHRFTLQIPAAAKQYSSDAKLKALDWYHHTKDGHENDAHRHMLTYLNNKHTPLFREHLLPKLIEGLE